METPITRIALASALTGTVATLAVTAALAALARAEGKGALQPVNATSHWLEGPEAGRLADADLRHTGTGFLTNHAAGIFWALPLTLMLRPGEPAGKVAAKAALVAGAAAVVDYGLVPKRLTPGWEHALGARGVAAGIGALALGLAAGALISRRLFSWSGEPEGLA